jgi:hypothetical protein
MGSITLIEPLSRFAASVKTCRKTPSYPSLSVDSESRPLDGVSNYVRHFDKDKRTNYHRSMPSGR